MSTPQSLVTDPFTIQLVRVKARKLCRRSDFSCSDLEDLTQGMLLHLVEKQHLFDPSRGCLEAFVTAAVNSWIKMELRYRGRAKRREAATTLSLEGIELTVDGDVETLGGTIGLTDLLRRTLGHQSSPIERLEIVEAVQHALGGLSQAEQTLLRQVAFNGVAGTARQRRVSRRKVESALARMRDRFIDAGLGSD